jgi:phosphoribosylamine---glycine ligase
MRVVVVGSGGREAVLAEVLARTATSVVVTPGNPGIPGSVATPPEELEADLYVVGPEAPLVDGLADRLRAAGRRVFGPGADGARLEGSKTWMKELVTTAGVPTARYGSFDDIAAAVAFLHDLPGPYVIKTDGLAAGKGVLVTADLAEAEADVRDKLSGVSFGTAGARVVIEEALSGPEVSVFAICDGTRAVALAAAQDYKRVADGDAGPNTGGMGAYSPVPWLPPGFVGDILTRFVEPTLAELRRRGIDYRGVLYAGLIVTSDGPKLIEYNVRFGDPDGQVALLRVTSDLTALLAAAADGAIGDAPTCADDAAVLVVAAAEGYPVAPRTGDRIDGFDAACAVPGASVYCAGVGIDGDGRVVTAGGRVLNVVGRGPGLDAARTMAYAALRHLSWPGIHHRTDIAQEIET